MVSKKLQEYNEKRDFNKTLEPQGEDKKAGEELKFVIQLHWSRAKHYDFRLEWGGVLLSWAIPKGPSYNIKDKRLAIQVEDHPVDYGSFEGTIPKGEYGGGIVMLWDEGTWEPLSDVEEGLSKGELKFALIGSRMHGNWVLIKLKKKSNSSKDNWLLIKEKDEFVKDDAGISQFDRSIKTGRTMEEIDQGKERHFIKNPFTSTDVQLAKLVDKIPKTKDYVYELKYDGYRILAFIEENTVRLMTRNNKDYTKKFKSIADSLVEYAKGRAIVFDGEMVITDDRGKTDFQELQNYLNHCHTKTPTYVIFDILALNGEDLRGLSLVKRKAILKNLLYDAPSNLFYSGHIKEEAKFGFDAACQSDLEGIIGKKTDSLYKGKRDGSWIKLKCDNRQEFIIGGYTQTDKKKKGISALLLGLYEEGKLIYVGRAGTGFSNDDIDLLIKKFEKLERKKSYFSLPPKERTNEKITWLKPELVAEINFSNWTDNNLLRQASYKALRLDKNPLDVTKDHLDVEFQSSSQSKEMVKKITHPNRVIYDKSEITKSDVAHYYLAISQAMLPYLKNRPVSVLRCPGGISKSCFFMKHPNNKSEEISRILIQSKNKEEKEYFYIHDTSGIIYEVQMGTLEFHPWASSVDNLEKPDIMVFDLDPDEEMEIEGVRQGVRHLKSILDELSLKSYLKTSGGKGYHLLIPLEPNVGWEEFRKFAKSIAQVMERKWPDLYTSNMRKEKRKNKIFVDWMRNGRGATSIAPYSIRARKGAKVSMPIFWEELDQIAPNDIDMHQALLRAKREDPWKGFFETEQRLGNR